MPLSGITAAILTLSMLFVSCFGIKSSATVNANGSGRIDLEYKVSAMFTSMGTMDGNKGLPALPVGEEDFRRTTEKIDGLTLKSFNSKEAETDTIYNARLEFTKLEALLAFLDTQGTRSALSRQSGKTIVTLGFGAVDGKELEPQMRDLASQMFTGYSLDFSLTAPSDCTVRYFGADSQEIPTFPYGAVKVTSRQMHFTAPMQELVMSSTPAGIVISW
jgi:hypothetical protein